MRKKSLKNVFLNLFKLVCRFTLVFRYETISNELVSNSVWPPARYDPGGLSGLFERLDSAFQSILTRGSPEGDTDSLLDSGSDGDSLKGKCVTLY